MTSPNEPRDIFFPISSQPRRRDGHSYAGLTSNGGQILQGDFNSIKNYYYAAKNGSDNGSRSSDTSSDGLNSQPTHHPKFIVPRCSAPYFTGRSFQLEQLQNCLSTPPNAIPSRRIVVIVGIGGAGKSQFCLKFAELHQSKYVKSAQVFRTR